jgi:hypothetical protein
MASTVGWAGGSFRPRVRPFPRGPAPDSRRKPPASRTAPARRAVCRIFVRLYNVPIAAQACPGSLARTLLDGLIGRWQPFRKVFRGNGLRRVPGRSVYRKREAIARRNPVSRRRRNVINGKTFIFGRRSRHGEHDRPALRQPLIRPNPATLYQVPMPGGGRQESTPTETAR